MSVTVKTMNVATKKAGKTFFAISATTTDGQGAEVIKAAPTTGSIYLDALTVHGDFDGTIDIGDGESASAVETIAMTLGCAAEGTLIRLVFRRPIVLTAAKALTFDCSAAGVTTILAEGYVIGD